MAHSRAAQILIGASLTCTAALAAVTGPAAWADSGVFVLTLFGLPLVCAAAALVVERTVGSTWAPATLTALGAVTLAWSLVTIIGLGLLLLVPSFLLLAAAVASAEHRRRARRPTTTTS